MSQEEEEEQQSDDSTHIEDMNVDDNNNSNGNGNGNANALISGDANANANALASASEGEEDEEESQSYEVRRGLIPPTIPRPRPRSNIRRSSHVNQIPSTPRRYVNIRVVTQDGNEVFFKIGQTTKMQKVIAAYCSRAGVSSDSVRFLYNGERIRDLDTPEKLLMEDNDVIDAVLAQVGGSANDLEKKSQKRNQETCSNCGEEKFYCERCSLNECRYCDEPTLRYHLDGCSECYSLG